MKIVHALGWYFPESLGGTEVYVEGLVRRLKADGYDVLVAAPDSVNSIEREYEHDGIPVYRYPIPAHPTRLECQELVRTRGVERFHSWLRVQRPDVVHFHTFVTGLGIHEIRVAKSTGARIIVTTHASSLGYICQRGTMMRWGATCCDGICLPAKCAACALHTRGMPASLAISIGNIPPAGGKILSHLPGKVGTALGMSGLISLNQKKQKEMLECVDKFVVLTQWAFEAVINNGAPRDKIILNRLGHSQTSVAPKPMPRLRPTTLPIKIGYFGRFESVKGVLDLAKAAASLPRNLPAHVEFRGPIKSEIEYRLVEELKSLLGDDPRFTFAPAVSKDEASEVLAKYDILCCPSICIEGGPTVALEAHLVGTPVIGSRIGGLAEIVTDGVNGRLVPPGDWRALAEVIKQMTLNPAGTIDRWRLALPVARTMDEVTSDYLSLYVS